MHQIDSVTLVDVLSMPIGFAVAGGRFRKVIEKNTQIPVQKTFRLPPGKPGQPLELDLFQGDGEQIIDNEYLGTLKPARGARRADRLQPRRRVPAARHGGGSGDAAQGGAARHPGHARGAQVGVGRGERAAPHRGGAAPGQRAQAERAAGRHPQGLHWRIARAPARVRSRARCPRGHPLLLPSQEWARELSRRLAVDAGVQVALAEFGAFTAGAIVERGAGSRRTSACTSKRLPDVEAILTFCEDEDELEELRPHYLVHAPHALARDLLLRTLAGETPDPLPLLTSGKVSFRGDLARVVRVGGRHPLAGLATLRRLRPVLRMKRILFLMQMNSWRQS